MLRLALIFATLALAIAQSGFAQAGKLDGRLITFKKTFDGWWDVACDTAPNGNDPRCYTQYVDPYSFPPKLRAVMVDFLYRKAADGSPEPVITLDVEPDLSFARDVRLTIVGNKGDEKTVLVSGCSGATCVISGTDASVMLVRWSGAKLLRWRIKERTGNEIVREWPLQNMRAIVQIMAEQRKSRGLP